MSATQPGREFASPDSRRRPRARPRKTERVPLFNSESASGRATSAGGAHEVPDPQPTPMPRLQSDNPTETWRESFARAERARAGRLRSLWQMTHEQRIAAMRRGELTYEQLAAWSGRHPDQVPLVNGEFEWIAMFEPEACE